MIKYYIFNLKIWYFNKKMLSFIRNSYQYFYSKVNTDTISNCIGFCIETLSKLILFSIGWDCHPDNFIDEFNSDKVVIIYPHTSYWDGLLVLLYKGRFHRKSSNIYAFIKPQIFCWSPSILTKIGFLESSRLEDRNKDKEKKGTIEKTTNLFKNKDKFGILISPKGTVIKAEWRSGYYWLAKQLNASILVAGFDYYRKRVVIAGKYTPSTDIKDTERYLKAAISRIIPRYPEREINSSDIYTFNSSKRRDFISQDLFPIDPLVVTNLIGLYPFYLMLYYNHRLAILGGFTLLISILYHRSGECNILLLNIDRYLSISAYLIYLIWISRYRSHRIDFIYTIITGLTYYCYFKGIGRDKTLYRTSKYYRYHTLFHLLSGLAITYPLL